MAEKSNKKYPKRAQFPKGKQEVFLSEGMKALNFSPEDIAKLLGVSTRTVRDWKKEKNLISLPAVELICKMAKIKTPKNITIKEPFWYVHKGAQKGGNAVYEKYGYVGGDPENRKKKWREWWHKKGQYKKQAILKRKTIKTPKYSQKTAELVGILLGDGSISNRQVTISLHSIDDLEYADFIEKLIYDLCHFSVDRYQYDKYSSLRLCISRTDFVDYCTNALGLVKGNKVHNQVDVPEWIRKSKKYTTACLRGLIDTDGSIFTHKYTVKGKRYSYKKLSFSNRSKPLIHFAHSSLEKLKIKSRVARQGKEVRIDGVKDMERYFSLIGSHNPKHCKKYHF